MSVLIETEWDCPACDTVNLTHVKKPNVFQSTTVRKVCESCGSNFMLKFTRHPNQPGKSFVEFLPWAEELSDRGLKLMKEKQDAQLSANLNKEKEPC